MLLFIILGIYLFLGYKSGWYILELNKQDNILLNDLALLILFTIICPLSMIVAICFFFENNGNKIVIKRKIKNKYCTCKTPIHTAGTIIKTGKDLIICTKCKKEMKKNSG